MKMKPLIIEDNPQMRQLIHSTAPDLAEAITEWSDGQEALAAYATQRFYGDDRVLMGLEMPRLGWLEATRRLRATFPESRIIIVTQYNDPHWSAAAPIAGACGYAPKRNCLICGGCCKLPSSNRVTIRHGDSQVPFEGVFLRHTFYITKHMDSGDLNLT
jgi:CheY-like chemotaxis protein